MGNTAGMIQGTKLSLMRSTGEYSHLCSPQGHLMHHSVMMGRGEQLMVSGTPQGEIIKCDGLRS
eukprot:gnl/Chilomastix_caulleri/6880.p1 GENE.gnl/Chilomastix_caulleri/6880~~gnl/Chilomastix_caulleri/6880.p1  ORF type:complete len:64 (+),score=21.54 gnl/Chilomastix_caulleri/6880:42-233(+)